MSVKRKLTFADEKPSISVYPNVLLVIDELGSLYGVSFQFHLQLLELALSDE
jgi:hypothetical protein